MHSRRRHKAAPLVVETADAAATMRIGAVIGSNLRPGDVVAVNGDVGAGKTTLVQGIAAGLDVEGDVTSPTFALVHRHAGRVPLIHADLYRIGPGGDATDTGLLDDLAGPAAVAIEWAEHGHDWLPADHLEVTIAVGQAPDDRAITIAAAGRSSAALLERVRSSVDSPSDEAGAQK